MAMATIVVVEDEKELNDIMCMYLRDAGYTVHGCLSANEAYAAMHVRHHRTAGCSRRPDTCRSAPPRALSSRRR